jgi:transcription initiation factor TFIIB
MEAIFPSIICCLCLNDQNVITDVESGEVICGNCGMVIIEKTQDTSIPEWRAFTVEEKNEKARTGGPTFLARHDRGLATIIGRANKDARGQVLDAAMRSIFERLRTCDSRTQLHSSADRNLWCAFSQLDILKDKLGLSDAIVEKTAYIYRKACKRQLPRGRTIVGMLAAAVYIACREMGAPRTLNEFAQIINIKHKDITRCYRDPMNCIVRIANRIKLSDKTKRQAIIIMNNIAKEEISSGKNPMGFAGSVLYLASSMAGDNIKQSVFAEAAGVTEVTIRNICRPLRQYINSSQLS